MEKKINVVVDGQQISVSEGMTLLEAARQSGIDIPFICYHEATTANALCRLCVVDVEGQRLLQPACIVKAAEGMKIQTRSDRVNRSRRTILELLTSTMDLSESLEINGWCEDYRVDKERYPEAVKRVIPLVDDNPMYIRDYSKCLLCWRCVQVCAEDAQYTFAINFNGRGYDTQIGTFFDKPIPDTSCVLCGQCVGVCPTGALKPKRQHQLEQGASAQEISAMLPGRRKRKK